jgi:hypothetical protein
MDSSARAVQHAVVSNGNTRQHENRDSATTESEGMTDKKAATEPDDDGWGEDREWDDYGDETDHAIDGHGEDRHILDTDPGGITSLTGKPSVKGGSEMLRMALLTFTSVGIASVKPPS